MGDEKAEATEKPLGKMTVKALREIAKEIPEITGVHGMKKEDLIIAINQARGVEEKTVTVAKSIKAKPVKKTSVTPGEIKKQIKAFKAKRHAAIEARDKKAANIYKRRISRLKKKTRKAAALSAS